MLELAAILVPAYIFTRMLDLFSREPAPHPAVRLVAVLTMAVAVTVAALSVSAVSEWRALGETVQRAVVSPPPTHSGF